MPKRGGCKASPVPGNRAEAVHSGFNSRVLPSGLLRTRKCLKLFKGDSRTLAQASACPTILRATGRQRPASERREYWHPQPRRARCSWRPASCAPTPRAPRDPRVRRPQRGPMTTRARRAARRLCTGDWSGAIGHVSAATERGEVLAQQSQQLVGAPLRAICRDCKLPSHMRVNGVGALNRPAGAPSERLARANVWVSAWVPVCMTR